MSEVLEFENTVAAQATTALAALQSLTCNQIWQQNEKTVRYLSLLCASQGNREFTEAELDQLRGIAEQCPEEGGDFVLLARSLVMDAEGNGNYEPSTGDFGCGGNPNPLKKSNEGLDMDLGMTISPNPASDYIMVKFSNLLEGELRVVDMQGRLVYRTNLPDGTPDMFLDTSNWQKGIYLCQYWAGGKILAEKKAILAN